MTSSSIPTDPAFVDAGFFVLRTPALAFDEVLKWNAGLEPLGSLGDEAQIARVAHAHATTLHDRLVTIMSRPQVREALFLASPDLEQTFDLWVCNADNARAKGLEYAMARYFLRMAGRATPFGLLAGFSVGQIAPTSHLAMAPNSEWRRHTRLDMEYLAALADAVAADPRLRDRFRYRPNSSLYFAGNRIRYARASVEQQGRHRVPAYHLVAVDETDALKVVLENARDGKSIGQLASTIVDQEISHEEAEQYVLQLIDSQILVPDIQLPLTGKEAAEALIEQFAGHRSTAHIAAVLAETRAHLCALDRTGLGISPDAYRQASKLLENLPAPIELSQFVHVDLVKPSSDLRLGANVIAEITRGINLLNRVAASTHSEGDALVRFTAAFISRYQDQLVPLTEALDNEIGVGFPVSDETQYAESPLLQELGVSSTPAQTTAWGKREAVLLRKIHESIVGGYTAVELNKSEVEMISIPHPSRLPDSFAMVVRLEAASEASLAAGDFRLLLHAERGPSAAVLLARFSHADASLREQLDRLAKAEQALHPEAVLAEIVHLPSGRMGNILARPVLREYEIPYLGYSGAASDRHLPVTDLFLQAVAGELKLYSALLRRQVIPRLASAHNFNWQGIPVYRFLAALQYQNCRSLNWDWGALEMAPFVPRLVVGKLVLARARWRIGDDICRSIRLTRDHAAVPVIQSWRKTHCVPRFVALTNGDNELALDLDNFACVSVLVDRIRAKYTPMLVELFPAPGYLCVHGPEGRYLHEIIVPFIRTSEEKRPAEEHIKIGPFDRQPARRIQRKFAPGSEWLYAKLYTGTATADVLLRDVVCPLTREVLASGIADRWFFIRYADPDWHLRLRLHGAPERLWSELISKLHVATATLLGTSRVWRIEYDTYDREIERYGGPEGMLIAERFFQIDSETALELLEQIGSNEADPHDRWRIVLRSMSLLLADLGLDLQTKVRVISRLRDQFVSEFQLDAAAKTRLSERFRRERTNLAALISPTSEKLVASRCAAIFRERSARLAPIIRDLKAREATNQLSMTVQDLARSYLHMNANRLLRSAHRAHEMVLYEFLERLYRSEIAREVPKKSS